MLISSSNGIAAGLEVESAVIVKMRIELYNNPSNPSLLFRVCKDLNNKNPQLGTPTLNHFLNVYTSVDNVVKPAILLSYIPEKFLSYGGELYRYDFSKTTIWRTSISYIAVE